MEYLLLALFVLSAFVFILNSHYRWTYLFAVSLFIFFFGTMLWITAQWQRALNFAAVLFVVLMLFHRLKIHYYKQPLLISDFIVAFDFRNWETLLHYKGAIFAILALLALFVYAVTSFHTVDSLGVVGHGVGAILSLLSFAVMFYYSKHPQAIQVWLDSLPDDGRDVFLNLPMSMRSVFFHAPVINSGNGTLFQQKAAELPFYPLDVVGGSNPDIVIWLHESTFDPQQFCFQSANIPQLAMYRQQSDRVLHRLLRVQTFGGATWKSEFAFLTGLPSSDFGAMANSVFYSVVPHTQYSLIKNLKRQGYYCVALSPFTKGNYNAEKAYRHLGFDLFLQPQDLGYPAPFSKNLWHIESRDMAKYAQMILQQDHQRFKQQPIKQPIFLYVLTMYEHGPYQADTPNHYQISDEDLSKHQIGLINDYIQRLEKLSDCMEQFNHYLQQRGKPYLLGYFGDHQPNFDGKKVAYQPHIANLHSPDYITQFTLRANFATNPIQAPQVIDIAQLGGILLEAAGLAADEMFHANIAMRKLGNGLQESDVIDVALLQHYRHYLYQQLKVVH